MGLKLLRKKGPGKNLVDFNTLEQGSFNYINGSETASNNMVRTTWIPVKAGQQYTFSCDTILPIGEGAYVYKKADSTIIAGSNTLVGTGFTLTIPSEVAYIKLRIGNSSYPHTVTTNYKMQLEQGSTATPYEPYQEYLYKGGVTNENDTTKRGKIDLSTLGWIYQTDGAYPVFRATLDSPSIASGVPPILTSAYKVHGSPITATFFKSNLLDKTIAYQSSSNMNQIMLQDSRFTDATALKAALLGKYLYYQRTTDPTWIPPRWCVLNKKEVSTQ